QLHRDAAIGMLHEALGVRQDAEPRAVGAHGKELSAVRVRAERIAGRVEHDRPSRRVFTGRFRDADAAAVPARGCTASIIAGSPSRKCVSWRTCAPRVSIENSWQSCVGLLPKGSAEALKSARCRLASRTRPKVSTRRKLVSWRRFLSLTRKTSLITDS